MKNLLYNFNIIHSRVSAYFSSEHHLHAERFSLPHEHAGFSVTTLDDFGLLLGIDDYGRYLQITTNRKRKQLGNVLKIAPTQGGKSTDFKHQLIHWKGSAIVNDIKGELYADTADPRREFSDIYMLDLQGGGNRFDPLMGKNTEDDLYAVAKLLLHEPREKDPAFTQRAIKMLKLLFMAQPNFAFIKEVSVMGINTLAKTIYGIDARLAGRLVDGDYNANKDYRDNKYLTDSWDSLTSRLEPFLTENVVKSLSGSSFRVADILTNERPVTIYLKWPESKLSAVQPVMKLLWGTFVEELKNVTNPRHKMLFLIDEGGVTPIPELYKHVATVNGRGMSFVIGIQDLSQLEGLYPTYYKTILNNCAQVFFRQQSLETAKYVSELLGGKSAFSSSQSIHGEETSEGKHEQKVALMSPQEIRGMGGTLLVFHPDLRYAIKARRMPEFVKPETAPLLLAAPQIPKSSIIWADNPAIIP